MQNTSLQEIPRQAYKLGTLYEKENHGCAQSTIRAIMEAADSLHPEAYRQMAGFAAGGGCLTDGNCGAYTAGIFFISMKTGRRLEDLNKNQEDPRASGQNALNFEMVKLLHDKFLEKYDTVICREIHKKLYGRNFNLLNKQEKTEFEQAGAHIWGCTETCGLAAQWTLEILLSRIPDKL